MAVINCYPNTQIDLNFNPKITLIIFTDFKTGFLAEIPA